MLLVKGTREEHFAAPLDVTARDGTDDERPAEWGRSLDADSTAV